MAFTVPKTGTGGGGTPITISYTPNGAGNSIVAAALSSNGNGVTLGTFAVSDSVNGSWHTDYTHLSGTNSVDGAVAHIDNISASATTITVTWSTTGNPDSNFDVFIFEVAGTSGGTLLFDQQTFNHGTTANATTGSTGTLATSVEFALAAIGNATATAISGSWSTIQHVNNQITDSFVWQSTSATTALSATWTNAASGWSTYIVTFQLQAAALPEAEVEVYVSPIEYETLEIDDGITHYPPTYEGVEATLFFQLYPPGLFVDYTYDSLESYEIDDGETHYPPQFLGPEEWFFLISPPAYLVFIDYSPEPDFFPDDDGETHYPPFASPLEEIPALLLQSFPPSLTNDLGLEPEEAYNPTDDGETHYPPFTTASDEIPALTLQLYPTSLTNDLGLEPEELYNPTDDGESVYPPFATGVEEVSFALGYIFGLFNDYTYDPIELLPEDDGETHYQPTFEGLEAALFLQQFLFSLTNDYSADEDTLDTGNDDSYSTVDDLAWLITLFIIPELAFLIFQDYTYDPIDLYELDTGDDDSYRTDEQDALPWFIPPAAVPHLIFNDYNPDPIELYDLDKGDDDSYRTEDDSIPWFIPPNAVSILIFTDTSEDDSQVIDDGETVYPPTYEGLEPTLFNQNYPISLTNDYSPDPIELYDTDKGDDDSYKSDEQDALSWFIPPKAITILIFNDYGPEPDFFPEDDAETHYPPTYEGLEPTLFSQSYPSVLTTDYGFDPIELWDTDTGNEDSYKTEDDLAWLLALVIPILAQYVFNDYSPDAFFFPEDDGESYYPPETKTEEWLFATIPPLVLIKLFLLLFKNKTIPEILSPHIALMEQLTKNVSVKLVAIPTRVLMPLTKTVNLTLILE